MLVVLHALLVVNLRPLRKQFPVGNVAAEPLPESVAMGATRIVMHQIVAPSEVDALGICFGGQVSTTGAIRDQM